MSTINPELVEKRDGIERLKHDAIEHIVAKETATVKRAFIERRIGVAYPTAYKIRLKGENILRRVYATPIGNASTMYIKTKRGEVYCELAVDEALHHV